MASSLKSVPSANAVSLSHDDDAAKARERDHAKTMLQIVAAQFFEHKLAVFGLFSIITLVLLGLLAPTISKVTGISPDAQNVFNRYKPAFSRVSIADDAKEERLEAFLKADPSRTKSIVDALVSAQLIKDTDEELIYNLVLQGDEAQTAAIASLSGSAISDFRKLVDSFYTFHVLGTDELGRDVFMRLLFGTRVSIAVGILVAFSSAIIGLLVGSLAGFYGGWVDAVLSRLTDALLSLPLLPLMIVFAAVEVGKVPFLGALIGGPNESIFKLVVVLVIFSWMTVARLVRGSILSIKEREFILAAKTLGAKDFSIIMSHIVPNVVAPLLVAVTLNVGNSILSEASLSFLGLGIQPPTPSWGNMLTNAQELIFDAPLLAIVPGLMILLTVVSFNFVGDGLQDAIDPKSIRR